MKLHDLVKSNSWLSVEMTLLNLYPDMQSILYAYRNVYDKLNAMEPIDNDEMLIAVETVDDDAKPWVTVSGLAIEDNETVYYSLVFTPWSEWLGMSISPDTFKEFIELEIISHCLLEMTFHGYEEQKVQEVSEDLSNLISEALKIKPSE